MRPIMKKIQYSSSFGMDSLSAAVAYSSIASSSSLICSTQAVVDFDKVVEFVLDLHCQRMIRTHSLLQPFMCIMNMCSLNTIMAHARKSIGEVQRTSAANLPQYVEVNKNAVILDDIDFHWYALEEDRMILKSTNINNNKAKKYDDVNLDLAAIHREAQKYNDYNNLQDSWSDLSVFQRCILCHIVRPHVNVFDQLMWFGYDCLIRSSNDSDLIKILEYNRVLNNSLGIPSNNYIIENLAVDFGINFTFARDTILSCDIHFEGSLRTRMSYTKVFRK